MAKRQLQYGHSGDDVRELQEMLNKNGASINADGIFGSATQDALKAYQGKSGLAADGIAGNATWGKLGVAPTQPSGFQSQYSGQIQDLLGQIQNRKPFEFDLNKDAMYDMYKDRYIKAGMRAMQDTIGQATTLTGGYDNSYAQSVGQQAYDRQLDNLGDKIPELYNAALGRYNQEGDRLMDQLNLYQSMDDREYARHRDDIADQRYEESKRRGGGGGSRTPSFNFAKWDSMWSAAETPEKRQLLANQMLREGVDESIIAEFFETYGNDGEDSGEVDTTVNEYYKPGHGRGGKNRYVSKY